MSTGNERGGEIKKLENEEFLKGIMVLWFGWFRHSSEGDRTLTEQGEGPPGAVKLVGEGNRSSRGQAKGLPLCESVREFGCSCIHNLCV